MKKITIYTLFLFVLGLGACGSSDSDEPSAIDMQAEILTNGTWMGNTAQATLGFESSIIQTLFLSQTGLTTDDLTQQAPITGTSITFNNDGTYNAVGLANEDINGTWELIEDGTKIIINGYEVQVPDGLLPPEIEPFLDLIQLTPENDTYDVKVLTENSLTIAAEIPQTIPANTVDGVPFDIDIIISIDINFTR